MGRGRRGRKEVDSGVGACPRQFCFADNPFSFSWRFASGAFLMGCWVYDVASVGGFDGKNQERTTFVPVCIAEYLSVYETERLVEELDRHGINIRCVLVNQLIPAVEATNVTHPYVELCLARRAQQQGYIKTLASKLAIRGKGDISLVGLPLLPSEVRGLEALQHFSQAMLHPSEEFSSLQQGLASAFMETMELD